MLANCSFVATHDVSQYNFNSKMFYEMLKT